MVNSSGESIFNPSKPTYSLGPGQAPKLFPRLTFAASQAAVAVVDESLFSSGRPVWCLAPWLVAALPHERADCERSACGAAPWCAGRGARVGHGLLIPARPPRSPRPSPCALACSFAGFLHVNQGVEWRPVRLDGHGEPDLGGRRLPRETHRRVPRGPGCIRSVHITTHTPVEVVVSLHQSFTMRNQSLAPAAPCPSSSAPPVSLCLYLPVSAFCPVCFQAQGLTQLDGTWIS